jgi:hypothetical protein
MPFEEALTRMNMGRLVGERHHLEQALELFEEMGARHFVALTREALADR